jgi:hypothetical protein
MQLIHGEMPAWTKDHGYGYGYGDGYGYGYGDGDGEGSGGGYGYGDGDGEGSGGGDGDGEGDGEGSGGGDGYGEGSGYGYGYGDGEGSGGGDGYGEGSGYGYGYGYGYGDGDGEGSGGGDGYGEGSGGGDGYGEGSGYGEYWKGTIQYFAAKWPESQRARLRELETAGATIAFWRSNKAGRACNGGLSGAGVKPGYVETIEGPLKVCTIKALHATFDPTKWQGERWWIVALIGEVQTRDNKLGALCREIIGECL